MPKINITLTDSTGVEYTGKEQVIFFPGSFQIKEGFADDNNCVLISTAGNLKACLDFDRTKAEDELGRYMIESYLSRGYEVLYHYSESGLGNLDFLEDKDSYNVKFLTAGIHNPVKTEIAVKLPLEPLEALSGSASTAQNLEVAGEVDASKDSIKFNFADHQALVDIASARKDCVVISGVDYDVAKLSAMKVRGDDFARCIKAVISGQESVKKVEAGSIEITGGYTSDKGEFAYLLVPNRVRSFTNYGADGAALETSTRCTIPAGFAYLMALGYSNINNTQWLPTANSSRGGVSAYGDSDIKMTKYCFDNDIIVDSNGIAFNGITYLRPYGDVIWGDRTMLELGNSVKATGYMSLMLVICDISKEAYNAAVRYTYESNNEVTWLNYKTRIVKLLDQMVTAGVLQSYKVAKVATDELNAIKARITVKPNLPVENFEIYVDLQNADLTVGD